MPRLPLQTVSYYDNSGGADLKSSATKVAENATTFTLNMDYEVDGALLKRSGGLIENEDAQILEGGSPAPILGMYDFRKSDGNVYQIIATGGDIYEDLQSPVGYGLSITSSNYPDFEFFTTNDDEYLIYGNGVDGNLKFNGTDWTNLSIDAPTSVPNAAIGGVGVLPADTYEYFVTFARYDAVLGVIEQESDVFRAGGPPPDVQFSSVTTLGATDVALTLIPVSPDPQVNARIIYRRVVGGANVFRRHIIIADNVTVAINDNDPNESTIDAEFDNQAAPTSGIFEEYSGRMFYVDASRSTDVRYSKVTEPWAVPTENLLLFDGPVQNIKRIYGAVLFGTDKSLWVLQGDPASLNSQLRRISSKVGILNNRCAAGEGTIYILATNMKFYALRPTDFANDEIRIDNPLSRIIDPAFDRINKPNLDRIQVFDYTKGDVSKIILTVPYGKPTNNQLFIFNETQSIAQGKPVWHFWDNYEANALQEFTINGDIELFSGNYIGYLWRMDQRGIDGDGAEINGTATAGTLVTITDLRENGTATAGGAATLTDAALSMTVNQYIGFYLAIVAGTGAGQVERVQSNTVDTFTIVGAWATIPDATSVYELGPFEPNALEGIKVLIIEGTDAGEFRLINSNSNITLNTDAFTDPIDNTSVYSVGGFNAYHYTNWKSLNGSYDNLKQLWYFLENLNASGAYTVDVIFQFDFDETIANQIVVPVILNLNNSIWGQFNWGEGNWGAGAVFQDRLRQAGRFRSIRIGFQNNKAGQPFQINGFSLSFQDKGQLFASD